jgi:hypothetical protein
LRVEDGNAALAACYKASSPVVVDVVSCAAKLDLLRFDGWNKEDVNILNWTIDADESGLLELQSSVDGRNFMTIYSRTINQTVDEKYDDYTMVPKVYYRLKITSSTGKEHYSKIILIDKKATFNIDLLQTKIDQTLDLQITSDADQKINYVIYDVRGIIISQSSLQVSSGVSRPQIEVGQLSSAMYLIRFEPLNSGKAETKRFIK